MSAARRMIGPQLPMLARDYVGQSFGDWTVVAGVTRTVKVLARCRCGTEKVVRVVPLTTGASRGCAQCAGTRKRRRLDQVTPGQRYGAWTATGITRQAEAKVGTVTMHECVCDCGARGEVPEANLKTGVSNGCQLCGRAKAGATFRRSLDAVALSPFGPSSLYALRGDGDSAVAVQREGHGDGGEVGATAGEAPQRDDAGRGGDVGVAAGAGVPVGREAHRDGIAAADGSGKLWLPEAGDPVVARSVGGTTHIPKTARVVEMHRVDGTHVAIIRIDGEERTSVWPLDCLDWLRR